MVQQLPDPKHSGSPEGTSSWAADLNIEQVGHQSCLTLTHHGLQSIAGSPAHRISHKIFQRLPLLSRSSWWQGSELSISHCSWFFTAELPGKLRFRVADTSSERYSLAISRKAILLHGRPGNGAQLVAQALPEFLTHYTHRSIQNFHFIFIFHLLSRFLWFLDGVFSGSASVNGHSGQKYIQLPDSAFSLLPLQTA